MQLIERGHAFAELHRLLTPIERGTGHVALVSGAIGSGKTELLHTFAEHALDNGAVYLSATGSHMEQDIPLGVVKQLFESASLPLDIPCGIQEALEHDRSAPAHGSDPVGDVAGPVHNRLLQHLTSDLSKLAESTPLLIGVDDLQHADTPSLQFFLWLSRRLRSLPSLLLFTDMEHGSRVYREFRAELLRSKLSTRIDLKPLTAGGVTELLATGLGARVARRLGRVSHELSGGNPLLARALIEDNMSASGETDTPNAGDAYGRAVLECVRRCGPNHALDVAQGIAVLDEHASQTVLSTLLSINSFDVTQAVDTLTRTGILRDGKFRHPRARKAILNDMSSADFASLHQRAATVAYSSGLPMTPIARFLLAAGHRDETWAGDVLREAARLALGEGRVAFAIECLQLACGSKSDAERDPEMTATLAAAERRVDPSISARRHIVLIAAAQEGHLSEHRITELIRALTWHGRLEESANLIEYLVQRDVEPRPDFYAWLRVSYPEFMTRLQQDLQIMTTQAVLAQPESAEVFLARSLMVGRFAGIAGLADQFLRNTRLDDQGVDSLESVLLALVYSDRPEQAAPWCDSLLSRATALRAPAWEARFAAVRAEIALRQGEPDSAEHFASMALERIPLQSWGLVVGAPLGGLIRAATAQGRHHIAAQWLTETVPAAMFQTRFGLQYQYARAEYNLATGRADLAFEDFLQCGRRINDWGFAPSALLPERASVTTAAGWLGDIPLAHQEKRVLAEQMAQGLPEQAPSAEKRKEPTEVLSAAEYRVAELASSGQTNRQISRKLCITTSTVEQHLTRVYRKLKVKNRLELTRVISIP
ncbi:LuxR family transcriptional regulator [Streptomyces sp. SID14515]|uniref:helix-turn-helix transcriptional regulator n=1 Tax=Streptomyces sp. SID14515 TaxID=2706074 RepID=UPI0013C7F502|nr:LuxR family transcriptional regulator [Streptomyces sp. SID14515]NEB41121.1 AAA family ATPase [Streptomyces sp. SID14515]